MKGMTAILLLVFLASCSDNAGFDGGAPRVDGNVNRNRSADAPGQTPQPTLSPLPTAGSGLPEPTPTPTETQPTPSIQPDAVVDGMEVINDCGRCLQRAQQLSPQAGFQASLANTANLGFYKIDPSRGLCDIHFLANFFVPIADHEGRDSVLDRQVALYCPCSCGWARDLSEPNFGFPF